MQWTEINTDFHISETCAITIIYNLINLHEGEKIHYEYEIFIAKMMVLTAAVINPILPGDKEARNSHFERQTHQDKVR